MWGVAAGWSPHPTHSTHPTRPVQLVWNKMLGSAQKAGQCRAGPPVIDSVEQSVKAFDRVNNTGWYGGSQSVWMCFCSDNCSSNECFTAESWQWLLWCIDVYTDVWTALKSMYKEDRGLHQVFISCGGTSSATKWVTVHNKMLKHNRWGWLI